jgi:hypothetical protein
MNLKYKIRNLVIITGVIWGLSISLVQAGVSGSMTLDITSGCFSYGASGATGCSNTDTSKLEYTTGLFTFNNTLSGISHPAAYAYQASISLRAEAPNNATISFDDTREKSFATLADLTSDPLWLPAYNFVNAVLANPTGSFTTTLPPFGPLTAFWNYTTDPGSSLTSATGSFEAWSTDNLNPVSQFLFGRGLPTSPVDFTLNIALNAISIPEPAMLTLIGLGFLGIGVVRKRKINVSAFA